MTRYSFAWALGCFTLVSSLLGCGDDGGNDGSGGSAGATAGSAGVTSGGAGSGSGGKGGSSTAGSSTGGSSTAGSSTGGSSTAGSSTGGSGGDGFTLTEFMNRAKESCELLDMTVVVKFADESIGARLTGRVVDGSVMVEGADEVLKQESITGHLVQLRWADGTADGEQVPVKGWLKQIRDPETDSRYRCFDGEVQVRYTNGGDTYYVFAAQSLSEAAADGTCGAATTSKEVVYGCLPARF
jgi:hypothetical protein